MTPRIAPSSAGLFRFYRPLFSALCFASLQLIGTVFCAQAQVINPTNNLPPFYVDFHQVGPGFETKGYTLQGPIGGGPLFSGLRLTRAGDYSGLFFGTRGQDVFKLDAEVGTFGTVPLAQISPRLAEQGWPTALGFDPVRREILLTSLGGEGYIHTYSAPSNQWRLLTSLNNWDVSDIALHGPTDTFYVVRNSYVSSPGQTTPLFISRIGRDGTQGSSISIGNLPFGVGFSDHEAELISVGEYLILLLEPGLAFHERNLPKESRIYLINPRTGQVTLTYRADWSPTPRNQLPSVSITAPSQAAVIEAGTTVKLTAIGTDVDGFVASLEFFVDGQSVGFGAPTINGAGMTFFELNWVATVGAHVITARATDHQGGSRISLGVAITVRVSEPVLPLVSVRAIDAEATEYPAGNQWPIPPDTAEFEISRERNLQSSFTVYFTLGGTATEHRDYVSPSNYVVFPAGVSSVRVNIVPMAAVLTVVELTESVILNIAPSPSGSYQVNANEQQAGVVILESGQQSPSLVIVEPSNGSSFEPGEPIHILAAGTGLPLVSTVQFKANGQVIGSSTYIHPTPGGQTFAIEAEDFDYDGGKHVSVADVMPYMGGTYEGLNSMHNVDYFRRNDVSEGNIYRFEESPNVPMFTSPEPTNSNRGTWEVTANYRIGWMDDGTWFNYTRNIPPGSYRVYAGLAHGDPNTTMRASLAKVTAGKGTESQTLQPLGEFTGPATGNWTTTTRVPLTVNGQEMQVQFGGETTLRFQGSAGDFDYLLLQSDNVAAPPRVIWHSFTWTNAPVGTHTITAETVLANGQVLVSSPVQIRVGREQPSSFVRRDLPEHFQPGLSFRVTLQANPFGTDAYAVEDTPPVGWAVSSVSHDGVFDRATGKVKSGPFTDGQARTLTYSVRAPLNATGIAHFSGNASRNGVLYPITGDQTINGASEFHPADSNQNAAGSVADKKITVSELTAYAAAWKSGQSWAVGPSPIPMSYVTRAAYIWKNGEAYRFEPGLAPPSCWVPLSQSNIVFLPRAATVITVSERIAPASIAPGASAEIQIRITSMGGSVAHAVEEKVPAGWSVSNITHEGTYDPATRTIRWGVFMDGNPRTLSYTLVAPAGVASVANLGGEASFDGVNVGTAGSTRVVATSDATAVSLSSTRTSSDGVQLKLTAAAGQSGIIEYSDDLVGWTELQPVTATTGSLEVSDLNPGHAARFYRFRID